MKLRLICSGLSFLPRLVEEGNPGGYRLPRVMLARDSQQFLPDFALLLFADELLMDRSTYEGLIRGQVLSGPSVPLLARLLHEEGFVRLQDFEAADRAQESGLAAQLAKDQATLDSWVPTVRDWSTAWKNHYQGIQASLRPNIQKMRDAASARRPVELDYSQQASKFIHDTGGRYQMANFYAEESLPPEGEVLEGDRRLELQTLVAEELRYARANVALCQEFGAALHDWCDVEPFYKEILSRGAKGGSEGKGSRTMQRLFELALPEFSFWNPDNVLRAVNDPGVRRLREDIKEAIASRKPLSLPGAKEVLTAVARLDHSISAVRLVTATLAAAPRRKGQKMPGAMPAAEAGLGEGMVLLASRSVGGPMPKKPFG